MLKTKQARQTQRIVMVDDEPDFLTIAETWLVPRYEMVCFTDGTDLLDELDVLEPDLLILDVRLPGVDGFKLCQRIRKDPRFQTLPILFLTASHNDLDFFRNIEVGGTSYLTKPVSRKELLTRVKELLGEAV
jgi:DNA-binding response OmpR family regulator